MGNKKQNIRRILRKVDKSALVFYSEFDGIVSLSELNSNEIDGNLMSFCRYENFDSVYFNATGRRYPDMQGLGPVSLWPSQYMQDWKKMLWNQNDLLECDAPDVKIKRFVFFQEGANNYYTSFIGLELIEKAPFLELELKKFDTVAFKRVTPERATEILSFMTTGFSKSELDAAAKRFVKYRDIFNSPFSKGAFVSVGGLIYKECIPYEGNEHLLGKIKSQNDGKGQF